MTKRLARMVLWTAFVSGLGISCLLGWKAFTGQGAPLHVLLIGLGLLAAMVLALRRIRRSEEG